MSGEKLSQAELARREQERLERERQQQILRLKEARRAYRQCCMQLREQQQQLQSFLSGDAFRMMKQLQPANAQKLQDQIHSVIRQLVPEQVPKPDTLEHYTSATAITRKKTDALYQPLLAELQSLRGFAVLADVKTQSDGEQDLQRMLDLSSGKAVQTTVFSFSFDGDLSAIRSKLQGLSNYLLWKTDPFPDLQNFRKQSANALSRMAADPQLDTYREKAKLYAQQVLNRYQDGLRQAEKLASDYEDYLSLCTILGKPPRPRQDFTEASVLKKELDALNSLYRKKDEMDFIADQINLVMQELGYTFVRSQAVVRQDGSEFDASLYQANDTAGVSVYTNETGAVMMRVTNLGEGPVTPEDEALSYQLQLSFCREHPEIIAALEKRGVYLRPVRADPPSKKFIHKVSLTQGMQTAQAQHPARDVNWNRRRRRHDNPKMRQL